MFLYVYTASLFITMLVPGPTLTSTVLQRRAIGSPIPVSVIARSAGDAMAAARGSLPYAASKDTEEWHLVLVSISSVPSGSE